MLLIRRLRWAGLAAFAVAALAWGQWRVANPSSDPGGLVVVTWNLQFQASSAAVLREIPFDVALLQEAGVNNQSVDVGAQVLAQLPPGLHVARGGHVNELMIVSKTPVEDVREIPCGPRRQVSARTAGLRFVCVHLLRETHEMRWGPKGPGYLERSADLRREQIRDLLDQVSGPQTILGGDFNTPPNCAPSAAIRGHFQDAHGARGGGFGLTFPQRFPLWRLDFLYVSPDLRVLACQTLNRSMADHRPVIARIARP